jgi:hypothetical protein
MSVSPSEPKKMTRDQWGHLIVKRIYDNTEPFTSPEDLICRVLDNPKQMFDYIQDIEIDRGAVRDLMDLLNTEKVKDKLSYLKDELGKAARRLRYQRVVIVVLVGIVGVLWMIVMGAGFWKFLKRNECAAYISEWKISRA